MAYNECLKERIERILSERKAPFFGKKMIGGYVFMVDEKICLGIHIDKKTNEDWLMARIGEEAMEEAFTKTGCKLMDFTGRPMKGFVFVKPEGFDMDEDLEYWIDLALTFNPKAQKSKK